ncbi:MULTISPECIES: hypothetical protein [Mycobacterium]|uniref:Uncharacterized protein n=1 Tax=Mycobacterium kiyosense TaxID=2871094 RepID=A0A9P3Q0A7_9MYCO|nr:MULTISPECIES: hypothetical protein [Mycobacterium]BDB42340.1 hypothetical protein IWGMT90018_27860 [Mycobacterium kiyosense]BDE14389.1 hypothetical protein MKCMC460_32490 [Mycobacterium sp. 20KCMC460]GLB83267.1 hypothetical protein SRL2020028_25230 [Mycobacterium kiyosense]GLB91229.1 hypothetical protein SRL2020130_40460 [Mycobacterium kiyosense]GLB97883.1 hypothetical protein SRL2020226_46590 [Mycobacterium kiyosense]
MSLRNDQTTEVIRDEAVQPSHDRGRTRRGVVNWVLALLTIPAAALIMIFAVGAAMSMAACSTTQCPNTGPGGLLYGLLFYGAPVVAAVTVLASFVTAFRRRGFVVPLAGLALLLVDFAAIAILF